MSTRARGVDKRAIVAALRSEVQRERDTLVRAAKDARDAATHEEAKPENDKDTRALEASYLAAGQAARVRELDKVDNALEFMTLRAFEDGAAISATAVVDAELDGAAQRFFLSPVCGGARVHVDGGDVQVITPQSPLGQALLGKSEGDVVELKTKQGLREYAIVRVR